MNIMNNGINLLTLLFLIMFMHSCTSQSNDSHSGNQDTISKNLQDSIEKAKKQAINQFQLQTRIADSLFLEGEYGKAKEIFQLALKLKEDTTGFKKVENSIKLCEERIAYENSPIGQAEKKLLGKKAFGIQFIWDGYSKAEIYRKGDVIKIKGSQFSKDKSEYCKIEGKLDFKDERQFIFDGNLIIYTHDCCGEIDTTGKFTFRKTGNRKYWRLKEFDNLCSMYTCAYYLDIFE